MIRAVPVFCVASPGALPGTLIRTVCALASAPEGGAAGRCGMEIRTVSFLGAAAGGEGGGEPSLGGFSSAIISF